MFRRPRQRGPDSIVEVPGKRSVRGKSSFNDSGRQIAAVQLHSNPTPSLPDDRIQTFLLWVHDSQFGKLGHAVFNQFRP